MVTTPDISNVPLPQPRPQQAGLSGFASAPQSPADTIQRATTQASSIGQYAFPDETIKYYMTLGISGWTFGAGSSTRPTPTMTDSIRLPLPESLIDLQTVNWERANLMEKSFAAIGALVGGGALLSSAFGQSVKSMGEGAISSLGAGSMITGAAIGAGLLTRIAGYAPNQFITILLNSPEYKQHNFTWNLAPKTPNEALKLKNIVQLLNNSMAPGLAGANLFWTFPKVFWIEFSPNPDYLFRFKPAVMTNFMVDYAGGHVPSFLRSDSVTSGNNPPESLHIQMQFLEIEYWKENDFVDGGYQARNQQQAAEAQTGTEAEALVGMNIPTGWQPPNA